MATIKEQVETLLQTIVDGDEETLHTAAVELKSVVPPESLGRDGDALVSVVHRLSARQAHSR